MMRSRDWLENLIRLRASELTPDQIAAFESELSRDPEAQREYARVGAELEQVQRAEPPEQAALRRRQIIGRAFELAAEPRPSPWSRPLRWAPAALIPVAAIALLFVNASRQPVEPNAASERAAALTLKSGNVETGGKTLERGAHIAPSTELRVVADRAELALWDESMLRAPRDTRVAYSVKSEDRLVLLQGELALTVKPRGQTRPLLVQTAEVDTWVIGTEFVVRRVKSGASFATTVVVGEGTVKVVGKPNGETRLLSAGQKAMFGTAATASDSRHREPPEGVADVPAENRQAPAAREPEARPVTVARIREKLRQGSIGSARQLIHQARAQGAGDAELSVLEAEADLAERRYASARQRYLRIVEQFPSSPQAELSLFAAAQLSHGNSGIDLLQRYLARYPNGRFSREAHRLLDTLDARRGDHR